jgi:hypothetical protein
MLPHAIWDGAHAGCVGEKSRRARGREQASENEQFDSSGLWCKTPWAMACTPNILSWMRPCHGIPLVRGGVKTAILGQQPGQVVEHAQMMVQTRRQLRIFGWIALADDGAMGFKQADCFFESRYRPSDRQEMRHGRDLYARYGVGGVSRDGDGLSGAARLHGAATRWADGAAGIWPAAPRPAILVRWWTG